MSLQIPECLQALAFKPTKPIGMFSSEIREVMAVVVGLV